MVRLCIPALVAAPAVAMPLFSQGPVIGAADVGLGFFSHAEPTSTNSFKHADNFVVDADARIGSVRWWGAGEGGVAAGLGNVQGFEIEIYGDNGGRPGTLLYEEVVTLGATGATATGRTGNGRAEFVHELTFAEEFAAQAGVTYWLAIAADPIDTGGDGWLWGDADASLGFDLSAVSRRWSSGGWFATPGYDSAFELIAVPAPSAGVMCVGVALCAGRRRR